MWRMHDCTGADRASTRRRDRAATLAAAEVAVSEAGRVALISARIPGRVTIVTGGSATDEQTLAVTRTTQPARGLPWRSAR